ncbi:MAG: ChbG/HpnK family deacetylase [Chloroflexota bacterium]|nr:MAG: ChbG/HpnK family deacetylase [Chloroflexota bacterium]
MSDINLCIMSDDFGMHPAVNEGIVRAFVDGVLTCADLMPPCPAFHEAARLAHIHHIPTGHHVTLTCEWDHYHWGPLTKAPSLTTPEGWLKTSFAKIWRTAKREEVIAEIEAQCQAMLDEGLDVTNATCHMAGQKTFFNAYAQIAPEYQRPIRRPEASMPAGLKTYRWDSVFYSTTIYTEYRRRKAATTAWLKRLEPGYHFWITHVALDHPSMDELTSPGTPLYRWTRPYRSLDIALLLDNEIKEIIAERNIRRISIVEAPIITYTTPVVAA